MQVHPPSASVLKAFGVGPEIRRLPGGQGTSWLAGNVVLKPDGGLPAAWHGEALGGVVIEGVRLATPIASRDGDWIVGGWTATSFVSGCEPDLTDSSTLATIVETGRRFHQAVAGVPRPDFLDSRDDLWAVADRVAWDEQPMQFLSAFADLAMRLRTQPDPPGAPQLVHGDLTGNVLFWPGLTPAVIDLSPYWRPPSYAEGVVIADPLCFHDATNTALETTGVPVEGVARALLFRLATTNALAEGGPTEIDLQREVHRYERAALEIGI